MVTASSERRCATHCRELIGLPVAVPQLPLGGVARAEVVDVEASARPLVDDSAGAGGRAGTGPSPVNRGKPGSKHHLICDGNGTPIYVLTSGANVLDISRALDLLDGYLPIAGRRGRPRRRFEALLADKG